MRIAVYGRSFKEDFNPSAMAFFQYLEEKGIKYQLFGEFADFLSRSCCVKLNPSGLFSEHGSFDADVDFFISIGGDGTFLEAVTFVRDSGIPLVGINSGRLGFLANISRDGISKALDALCTGAIVTEERTLIELVTEKPVFDDFQFALNELAIQKKGTNMITIEAYVAGEFLNAYRSDGLIISTPTGSTAYSMSVGGPILVPGCNNFVISPIAPHSLAVRPLLIPDHHELVLRMNSRNKTCLVSLDHRFAEVRHTTELSLRKAGFTIKIVNLPNQDFYSTLRNKLMWGVDIRN